MCVVLGVARALQMPAQQAIVPALVPLEQLPRAFALSSTLLKLAVIGGSGARRIPLRVRRRQSPTALASRCWSVASALRRGDPAHSGVARTEAPVSLASLFAGFAFIWRKKQVLGAISLDLFAVLLGGATALLPIYAKDILAHRTVGTRVCCARARRSAR